MDQGENVQMCDLKRSSSSKSHTKSCNLTVPRNMRDHETRDNLVSTGSQTEFNVSNKRPSVQFSASSFGLKEPGDHEENIGKGPAEADFLSALPPSSFKSSWNKGIPKRESIFSTFSQVAGRSQRPSIFSRLSDQLSQISNTSSFYGWNYSRVFLLLFCALTALILIIYFILFFVPQKYYL